MIQAKVEKQDYDNDVDIKLEPGSSRLKFDVFY